MKIFSKTDKGLVRKENQDAFFADKLADGVYLAVVCDGMGGANAGNVASANAVRIISEYIRKSLRKDMTVDDAENIIGNSLKSANIEIYDMSVGNPEFSGMGTTAVVAMIIGREVAIAHVGDSRIYLINSEIKQLTKDHSVVQSLIESGKIMPEDAKFHPRKNVITRALGTEDNISPDFGRLEISEGDSLLLCSDGLTNYLEDDDIFNIIKSEKAENVVDKLIDTANKNGGGDNITVVSVVC